MNCRHCGTYLVQSFVDLGFAPPSNAYLSFDDLSKPETYYPLRVKVCDKCWLVQTEDYPIAQELFSPTYAYLSSTSESWLAHAAAYADMIVKRLQLNNNSLVIEIASNDGYLLKNFIEKEIPCLGIEPTDSTARIAEAQGIKVLREFFGEELADKLARNGQQADLIVGNNVFAHVPLVNDFTRGLKQLLKPSGTITLEFPHLMRLIECSQFDTIYHEHFSYFSLQSICHIFESAELRVWDLEELPTHGGSLRVYGCHRDDLRATTQAVRSLLAEEVTRGLQTIDVFSDFQRKANNIKDNLLEFLIEKKREGKTVIAYGAAAKGNTLLNYAGIKSDLIPFVCDAAPSKQGKYLPGSHIPIFPPERLKTIKVDYLLILPWNIAAEIKKNTEYLFLGGTKFLTVIPDLHIE